MRVRGPWEVKLAALSPALLSSGCLPESGKSPLFIPGTHFTPQPGPSAALLLRVYPSGHWVSQGLLPHPAQWAVGDQKPHSFSPGRSPQGRRDKTRVPGDTRVLMALTPRSHASVLGAASSGDWGCCLAGCDLPVCSAALGTQHQNHPTPNPAKYTIALIDIQTPGPPPRTSPGSVARLTRALASAGWWSRAGPGR